MAYSLSWGRQHPGHLVYIVDLSGSMQGQPLTQLLDVLYQVSESLVDNNLDENGDVMERFTLTIIGYNSDVMVLKENMRLAELEELVYQVRSSGRPLLDVKAQWQTYTAAAYRAAAADIRKWIAAQQAKGVKTPAPVVIHITDGEPYEAERSQDAAIADALKAAGELKAISTPDGNTLLFNIHIAPKGTTSRFLSTPPSDRQRRFLYDASSVMDDAFARRAKVALSEFRSNGVDLDAIRAGSRFMVSNETNKNILVQLIVFGSTVSGGGTAPQGGNPLEPPKPRS